MKNYLFELRENFGDGIGNLTRENEWGSERSTETNNRLFVLSLYCLHMELLKWNNAETIH